MSTIRNVVDKYSREASSSEMEGFIDFLKEYHFHQDKFAQMYPKWFKMALGSDNQKLAKSFAKDIARRFDLDPDEVACDIILEEYSNSQGRAKEFESQIIITVPEDTPPDKMQVIGDFLKDLGGDGFDISEEDEFVGFLVYHRVTHV